MLRAFGKGKGGIVESRDDPCEVRYLPQPPRDLLTWYTVHIVVTSKSPILLRMLLSVFPPASYLHPQALADFKIKARQLLTDTASLFPLSSFPSKSPSL